jgi:hypothetical protein
MKLLSVASLIGLLLVSWAPAGVIAQVASHRNPGRAFQRLSKFKTYDECLRHNLRGMAGDTRRASRWCSRQGYTQ